jgi:hypothetical protein
MRGAKTVMAIVIIAIRLNIFAQSELAIRTASYHRAGFQPQLYPPVRKLEAISVDGRIGYDNSI